MIISRRVVNDLQTEMRVIRDEITQIKVAVASQGVKISIVWGAAGTAGTALVLAVISMVTHK